MSVATFQQLSVNSAMVVAKILLAMGIINEEDFKLTVLELMDGTITIRNDMKKAKKAVKKTSKKK